MGDMRPRQHQPLMFVLGLSPYNTKVSVSNSRHARDTLR